MAGANPHGSPYPTTASGKELDLRKEINRLLYGAIDEEAKGRWSLLRRMRRDSNGNRIRCACRDNVTDEPDKDYYCRYCVLPTAAIPTENGIRQAKDIIPGMKVLSKDGKYHLVTNTFARLYKGKMTSLYTCGRTNMPLTVTCDHRVFVLEKQQYCHIKKSYGKICNPETCKAQTCKIKTNNIKYDFDIVEKRADEICPGDYVAFPKIKNNKQPIEEISIIWDKYKASRGKDAKQLNKSFVLDDDFMFLLGWYVAEGSGDAAGRKTRSVVYSLRKSKEQWVVGKLLKIFKEKFGVDGIVKEKKDSDSVQVVFGHAYISRWLHDICGRYSDGKHIPNFVWHTTEELKKVFLDNFMLGDGHKNNKNFETAGITSKILAEELYVLAFDVGYYPSISFKPAYSSSDGQSHADSWYVSWYCVKRTNPTRWRRRFSAENFVFSRVEKTHTSKDTITAVYDFTVDEDHSFVADGILTHNCLGMGYYWDEVPIVQYRDKTSFKKVSEDNREFVLDKFFVEYDTIINDEDYIVTVKLDQNGSPITPVTREKYFKIASAVSFRSDSGRIEFWEIRAKEEFQWSIWYGVQRRQS
jgi:intein/homing endonuclease